MTGAAVLFKGHADVLVFVLEFSVVPSVGEADAVPCGAQERRRAEEADGVGASLRTEAAELSRKLVVHAADTESEHGAVHADGAGIGEAVVPKICVRDHRGEVQAVAALREVRETNLCAVAVASRGLVPVVLAVEDEALPPSIFDADGEVARAEVCTRREEPCRLHATEGGDVIQCLLQTSSLDGCARVERVRKAADLPIIHGGTVLDIDIAIASCENTDLKCAVRIRLRREIDGCGGVAVAACVLCEIAEECVQLRLGDRALRIACRAAVQLVRAQLRTVLRDGDACETECGTLRTALRYGQMTLECILLRRLSDLPRIGRRQIRRRQSDGREEKCGCERQSATQCVVGKQFRFHKDFSPKFIDFY